MTVSADTVIELRGIRTQFGTNIIHDGVDLSIKRGEVLGIVGGSGTGKSVLLRHAIGLHHPDQGEVWVDGRNITEFGEEDLLESRKKVGMLFQAGALFDSMTVAENVAFALHEHTDWDDEKIAARIHEVSQLVELADVEELMPSDLSGGMRKRVALARAVALAPQAILYDEPTTGLDPITSTTIPRASTSGK